MPCTVPAPTYCMRRQSIQAIVNKKFLANKLKHIKMPMIRKRHIVEMYAHSFTYNSLFGKATNIKDYKNGFSFELGYELKCNYNGMERPDWFYKGVYVTVDFKRASITFDPNDQIPKQYQK